MKLRRVVQKYKLEVSRSTSSNRLVLLSDVTSHRSFLLYFAQKPFCMKLYNVTLIALPLVVAGCDDEKNQDPPGDLSAFMSINFGLYRDDGASGYDGIT
jgi:hypothetical protein